jgi:hypothetical protein
MNWWPEEQEISGSGTGSNPGVVFFRYLKAHECKSVKRFK